MRGGFKRIAAFASIMQIRIEDRDLCFCVASEQITLALGADAAARWARKLAAPPRSLREKLGVGAKSKAFVLGAIGDPALEEALEGATTKMESAAAFAIAVVVNEALRRRANSLETKPIWIVHFKGRHASFGETVVRSAMRLRGFVDTKVAAVSSKLTAIRYSNR